MGRSANRRATARNVQRKKQLQSQTKSKLSKNYHEVKGISKQVPVFFKPDRSPRYL
ncbi:MAG: hypothetical protein ACRC5S_10330 [Cetobacterium sp.]